MHADVVPFFSPREGSRSTQEVFPVQPSPAEVVRPREEVARCLRSVTEAAVSPIPTAQRRLAECKLQFGASGLPYSWVDVVIKRYKVQSSSI